MLPHTVHVFSNAARMGEKKKKNIYIYVYIHILCGNVKMVVSMEDLSFLEGY